MQWNTVTNREACAPEKVKIGAFLNSSEEEKILEPCYPTYTQVLKNCLLKDPPILKDKEVGHKGTSGALVKKGQQGLSKM